MKGNGDDMVCFYDAIGLEIDFVLLFKNIRKKLMFLFSIDFYLTIC